MSKLYIIIGQIFVIAIIQSVIELFLKQTDNPYLCKILTLTCYAGCLYIVLDYVFNDILSEIISMFNFMF